MTCEERAVYCKLRDFLWLQNRIKELEFRLSECSYKLTTSYSLTGGSGSGCHASKLEDYALREMELLDELQALKARERIVKNAVQNGGLNSTERKLAECLMDGYTLAAFARRNGFYKSSVYKIRDKALKKVALYIKNHAL